MVTDVTIRVTDLDEMYVDARDRLHGTVDRGVDEAYALLGETPGPTDQTTAAAQAGEAADPTGDSSGGHVGDSGSPSPTGPVVPARDCSPTLAPVDPDADGAARCLAETLDRWSAEGVMGVGQQVNISSDAWAEPLEELAPQQVAVVGFDLAELVDAAGHGKDWSLDLATLVADGAVLTASWHAPNPWTGGGSFDTTGQGSLDQLLDEKSDAGRKFWKSWGKVLDQLALLQDQNAGVLVRPLHEAGGSWFWWGRPDPATYRAVWTRMQEKAAEAGVHNLLWAYGAALKDWEGVDDPVSLVPERVDLVGLDTYDCETPHPGCGTAGPDELAQDRIDLTGYAELAAVGPRVALTEVGPHYSEDGSWDPAVISSSLAGIGQSAAYAMLWFDDSGGLKQLSSLRGGRAWLESCPGGLCRQ